MANLIFYPPTEVGLYLKCSKFLPIPFDVSGLQSLQSFFLSSNLLNGTIPSWIFSLPSLDELYFNDNYFSGEIQEFKSKTLWDVTLKQNQLQGPIPMSLLNQQSLSYLLLSQNNRSGQIASASCSLKALTVLDLGSNNLKGTIPRCLGEISGLWVFDLSNNNLSGAINTTFNLGNNELSDTFPKWLGTLPNLKILSLRSNKFHGPIKTSRAGNLFVHLRIIDLSSNGFSGNLPMSLFENLKAMKIIDEITKIPQYVGEDLYYYYHFSETITTKGLDLEFRGVLTTNIVINLSKNRFEGCIPSSIGDLIALRTLNLSHNGLEGVIPTSLQYLSVLESLDFSFNKISGEIPQQLASLTFLAVLNLSHNHLVGCIPRGKQFDTFENSSYQGNDELRGLPLSKDCGDDEGVPQATTPFGQGEEGDSLMISWQPVLMGYGCGLIIGLSESSVINEELRDKVKLLENRMPFTSVKREH
ncbi:receptor-like protein Cf-9 homolog [Solanum stenotomum]|uniref:receptor-like protein Cf-9 homolog n=1 Tax=Solanum stenotomum TaxID=172797 RepID=UPI0020D09640|nr:receptor-like protein Cf-9 homolog [Solanum stenotomum]